MPPRPDKIFADAVWIQAIRERLRLTQQQLADEAGKNVKTIQNALRREPIQAVEQETLEKIFDCLHRHCIERTQSEQPLADDKILRLFAKQDSWESLRLRAPIGRTDIYLAIRDVLRQQSAEPRRVAIHGPIGAGKSRLLRSLMTDSFLLTWFGAENVIYRELSRNSNVVEELQGIVYELKLNDSFTMASDVSPAECLRRLQSRLKQRTILFVLDDVWDSHEVALRDVIAQSPDSAMLVATRDEETAYAWGQFVERIEAPSDGDAIAIVRSYLGTSSSDYSDASLNKIISIVGKLPLCLHLVAGLLRRGRPSKDDLIDDVLTSLKVPDTIMRLIAPQRGETVAALFDALVERLSGNCRERYFALAAFDHRRIKLDDLACVWSNVSCDQWVQFNAAQRAPILHDARKTRDELRRFGLIEPVAGGHDDIRTIMHHYAQFRMGGTNGGDVRIANVEWHRRHARHFLAKLAHINSTVRAEPAQGLPRLYEELAQIKHAQRWAAEHLAEDSEAAEICFQFSRIEPLIHEYLPKELSRAWIDAARRATEKLGNVQWINRNRIDLGIIAEKASDYLRAREFYEQALMCLREDDPDDQLGFALVRAGFSALRGGQLESAESLFAEALETECHPHEKSSAISGLAEIYLAACQYSDAIQLLNGALQSTTCKHCQALITHQLAIAHRQRGEGQDQDTAIKHLRVAVSLFTQIPANASKSNAVACLELLSGWEWVAGNRDESLRILSAAIRLALSPSDRGLCDYRHHELPSSFVTDEDRATAMKLLAMLMTIFADCGRLDEAEQFLMDLVATLPEESRTFARLSGNVAIAFAAWKQKEKEYACKLLQSAAEEAVNADKSDLTVTFLSELGGICAALELNETAIRLFSLALDMSQVDASLRRLLIRSRFVCVMRECGPFNEEFAVDTAGGTDGISTWPDYFPVAISASVRTKMDIAAQYLRHRESIAALCEAHHVDRETILRWVTAIEDHAREWADADRMIRNSC